MIKKIYLSALLCFAIFLIGCSSFKNIDQSYLTTYSSANISFTKKTSIKDALENLNPQIGDSGLLLAFDTDVSQDRQNYSQFYDSNKEFAEKNVTNRTFYLTRKGNEIKLASELNFVASPQKDGFLYLGQARYFEPKPRDKNEHLDSLEKESETGFINFGFDYTRIWKTDAKSKIPQAKILAMKKTKSEIDNEYKRLKFEDREYHRNITDYRKISFISNGFYTTDGFWSLIHGGAAWFEGRERADVVSLAREKVSPKLKAHLKRSGIENGFKQIKDEYGEHRWSSTEKIGYVENSTFNFARYDAKTHLLGLITIDGNSHRSFYAEADFGQAPNKFISYDNPNIDFDKFKNIYPSTIDVFVSPNQNTVFVLTKKKIIGIDVKSRKEIYNIDHNLQFNKIIMVEWALNDFVPMWESELNSN